MPLVSVIMPNYNGHRFVEQAIQSVLSQTFSDFELIVVDDCSTDDSFEIIQSISKNDSRIRVEKMEKNSGVASVRNYGIQLATGKYIALLDNDDLWTEDKLQRQVELIQKSGAPIVYCSYDFIDENNNEIKKPFIVPTETNYKKMLASNVISCSTIFIDASLLKNNLFDPSFYHEDYVLWMKFMSIPARAVGDLEVLMHYRQVSTSRSHKKINAAKERWAIYRKSLKLSVVRSMIAFLQYAINGLKKYC